MDSDMTLILFSSPPPHPKNEYSVIFYTFMLFQMFFSTMKYTKNVLPNSSL